jgi:hypothetical protein
MRGLFHSRALTALLLAVLLAGRLVVPTGWMPVAAERGIAFVLCSSEGPAPAWIDASGKLHKGKQDGEGHRSAESCPFAAFSAPLDLAAGPDLATPAIPVARSVMGHAAANTVGHGLAAPPPPATGPPLSA